MQLKQSNFFLKNYPYQIGVNVPGEEYEFTIVSLTKEFKNLERLKAELEDSRETAVLQITKAQTEAQALSVAQDVKNLLQLGLAYRVIFDRQEYVYELKTNPIH